MKIEKSIAPSPKGDIEIYRITNSSGAYVELSSLGAGIMSVNVPDNLGNIENVALSYANPADYIADGPCMGKVPGRYANRIAGGHLCIEGKNYQLTVNNGPNALHGGPEGFQNQIWNSQIIPGGVRFTYHSADGEEQYPGALTAVAEYRWSEDNTLELDLSASADATSVVNLTNHTYWNLDGADSGSVLNELLSIKAEKFIPTDETLIPLGHAEPVVLTPMDFRSPKALGTDIDADFPALKYGKGYDAGWLLDGWRENHMLEDAVTLYSKKSKRRLRIDTDQPVAHVYTGNWLAGSPLNRSGRTYNDYEGVAIEMQGVPDAPNQPQWPSQTILPGTTYHRTIRFRLDTAIL